MKVSSTGIGFSVVAVFACALVYSQAFGQAAGPSQQPADRFGSGFAPPQMAMQGMGQVQVVNDPMFLFIVRPDRVIRVEKGTMRITGETALPGPMRPGAPPPSRAGGGGD